MDPLTRILWRLAQWWRHPPSPYFVRILVATLLVVLAVVLVERFIGWPEWLRTERVPIRRL
ncbi:hypothetical protein [Falsiroseomonas selenitidurans]|uniref:Uncharacterized protein n=1 Tax=Falsiroseomonas selenitidurans TaxID=2716335 RepID=A0ABX1E9S3_9PROT|nr:hypothetical protein [Falsiroseomonas selenitidurans]NKC32528.1 hypothetical protein [Falsiroseomonas selenitidurans]